VCYYNEPCSRPVSGPSAAAKARGSWTAQVPTSKTNDPIYEYACHEGNYALPSVLAGARADEVIE